MKIEITCITPVLQAILDFFPDIISFQHMFHLGVGRSQIEWKLKAKTQISVFPWAKIGQNDHSNPYIESTTVLSDIIASFPDPRLAPPCARNYCVTFELALSTRFFVRMRVQRSRNNYARRGWEPGKEAKYVFHVFFVVFLGSSLP